MKIEIDLNINIPQLASLLASTAGAGVSTPAAGKAPAAKPVTKAPSPTAASASTTQEAGPDATTAASPSEDATIEDDLIGGDGPTIDDVKEAAKAYNVKNGRDALAALIGEHGGSKGVTTIPEGNYQAFIDAANA